MLDAVFWILAVLLIVTAMSALEIRDYIREKWQKRRNKKNKVSEKGQAAKVDVPPSKPPQ
jgi:hypothetical protein